MITKSPKTIRTQLKIRIFPHKSNEKSPFAYRNTLVWYRKELRKQTVRLVHRMIFLREISHQKSLLKNAWQISLKSKQQMENSMFQQSSIVLIPQYWDWQWKPRWRQRFASIRWKMLLSHILKFEVQCFTPIVVPSTPVSFTAAPWENTKSPKVWTVPVVDAMTMRVVKACGRV